MPAQRPSLDEIFAEPVAQSRPSLDEIFAEPVAPVAEPSFTERVSADWDKRNLQAQEAKRAYDTGQITTPELGLRAVGIGARKLNDLVGEAATSAGQGIAAITPEAIKQPISEAATSALESDVGQAALQGAEYVADKYGQLKQKYPAAIGDIEDVASIAGAIPASLGITKGAKGAAELTGDLAVTTAKPNIAEGVKPLARRAREFGIDLRSDQVAPTRLKNTIQKVSQEVPFSGAGEFEAKQRAQWNKALAERTLGLDTPDVSPESLIKFLDNSSVKFDALAGKKSIPFDASRVDSINKIVTNAEDYLDPGLAHIVKRNAKKITASIENGSISGAKLGSIRSELIDNIPGASGGAKGHLSKLIEAIDASIEPVLTAQEKETLKTARRQWRNYKTFEVLLEKSPDGQINPTQLLDKVAGNKFIKASRLKTGEDDLVDLARIGKQFLPMKAGSDTAQKIAIGKAAAGGAGATGLAGYAYADPIGALGAAGVAGAGMAANRAYQGVNTSQKLIDAALKERKARFGLKDLIKDESGKRPNLKTKIKNLAKDESGSVGGLPDDFDLEALLRETGNTKASKEVLSDGVAVAKLIGNARPQVIKQAKELGFDTDRVVYRGLGREYDEARAGSKYYQMFTHSGEQAGEYAEGIIGKDIAPNVVPAFLRKGKNLSIDAAERNFNALPTSSLPKEILDNLHNSASGRAITTDELAHAAKNAGYDSVTIRNVFDNAWGERTGKPTTVDVVFDPKNIRSVNAKFDPSKANSADLMALRAPIAVSGAGGAAAYALSPQDAKAEKPTLKTKIKKKD